MSKIGSLNKRISIYRPKVKFDGYQNVNTFEKVADVYASVTPVSDAERFRANAVQATSMARFSIRKPRAFNIDNTYRIQYDGFFYDVNGSKAELDIAFVEITAVQVERVGEDTGPVEPPYVAPSIRNPSEIIREDGVLRLIDADYAGEFTHITRTLTVVRDAGLTDLTSLIVDGEFAGELDVVGSTSTFTFETVAHGKRGEAVKSVATLEIEPRYVGPFVITPAGILREADDRLVTTPATFGGAVQSVTHELTMTLLEEVTIITPILFDGVSVGEMEHVEGPTRYDFVSTAYGERLEIVTSSASIEVEQKYVPIAVATETELALVDGKLRITPATFTKHSGMWGIRLFKIVDGARVSVSHEVDASYVYQGNLIFADDTVFIAETFAFGDRQEQAISDASYSVAKRDPAAILKAATITRDGDTLTVSRTEFGGDVVSIDTSWTRVVSGVTEDLVLPADGVFAPAAIHRAGAVYRFTATATGILGDTITDTATIDIEAFYIAPREVTPSRIEKFSGQTLTFITGAIVGDVERWSERFFVIVNGEQTDISAQVAEAKIEYALNWNDQTFIYQFVAHAFDGSEVVSEARYTVPAYIPISLKTPGQIIVHPNELEFIPAQFDGQVIDVWTQLIATENGAGRIITSQLQDGKLTIIPKSVDVIYDFETIAFGAMNEDIEDHAIYTVPAVVPIAVAQVGKIEKIDDTLVLTDATFSGDVSAISRRLVRSDGINSPEDLTHLIDGNTFPGPTAMNDEMEYSFVTYGHGPLNTVTDVVHLTVDPLVIGPIGAPISETPSAQWSTITDPVDGYQYRLGVFDQSASVRFTRAQEIQYAVIAPGGGAPYYTNSQLGGAGAGGILQGTTTIDAGTHEIVIGVQGYQPPSAEDFAIAGTDTIAFGLRAVGGGRGGSIRRVTGSGVDMPNGGNGGSGGGAGGRAGAPGGVGVPGQGFNGGSGSYNHPSGGSGAGGAGAPHSGGVGIQINFRGFPEWVCSGGRPGHNNANGNYVANADWIASTYGSGANGGPNNGETGYPPGLGKPGAVFIRYRLAS